MMNKNLFLWITIRNDINKKEIPKYFQKEKESSSIYFQVNLLHKNGFI